MNARARKPRKDRKRGGCDRGADSGGAGRENTDAGGDRLWDKGGALDAQVHAFTVGEDPVLDRTLVYWDCLGSAAHARTLKRAGLLSDGECAVLISGLAEIARLASEGRFEIPAELEDGHTAIEAHLTHVCGEPGEKIHTGRSRNDQVAVVMRLWMRDRVLVWIDRFGGFVEACLTRIGRDGDVSMPGYTHMQRAMPSSVGLWLHAFAEAAGELMRSAWAVLDLLDACPLGTGAGFGVGLNLDRAFTARLLGFTRVQRNPIDVQNSRGRMETYFVRLAVDVGALMEKLSCDLILYSTAEFGFVSLPAEMTTGSSIMPQKKNPDLLELIRARAGYLRGLLHQLEWVTGKLPSSYHRDLQLTKPPAIESAGHIEAILSLAPRVVEAMVFDRDRLESAMSDELYATEAAYRLVARGVPFRQAYRTVAQQIQSGTFKRPRQAGGGGVSDRAGASDDAGVSDGPGASERATVMAGHVRQEWLNELRREADEWRRRAQTDARALDEKLARLLEPGFDPK